MNSRDALNEEVKDVPKMTTGLKVFRRSCDRCDNIFKTKARYGRICKECTKPKGKVK